ncbi:ester cyclase [Chitinophaga sp. RAB17]|uniref:ester cyclase n=1 Tax=Chitinophaga sp. RAB17 TaxID=3233049 RepID=UPI003F8F17F0
MNNIFKCIKFYVPGQSKPLRDPNSYLMIIGKMHSGFSGIQWTLEEMVSEENETAIWFTMQGTHDGAFFRISPTGKSIKVQAMNFY